VHLFDLSTQTYDGLAPVEQRLKQEEKFSRIARACSADRGLIETVSGQS
jgi:hypothetical protein